LAPTDSVWCYGVFAGATTKEARLEIASGDRTLQSTSFTVGGAIWTGWVSLTAPAGQKIAAGSYTCRFWLDGRLVQEKPFEVGA
jgi:hypothetical protein